MKKILLTSLVLFATFSAQAGVEDCAQLIGKFSCLMDELQVPLEISQNQNATLKIEIAGEGQDQIMTDGQDHKSVEDDSTYSATCDKATGLTLISKFKDIRQSVELIPTAVGVQYKADSATLNCVRK